MKKWKHQREAEVKYKKCDRTGKACVSERMGRGKRMKAVWRKAETCGCAESSWELPCSGRLIEALGGSRLWAVTPMKSPFAAFCSLCAEFWWSSTKPRPLCLCHTNTRSHTHTHKLGHTLHSSPRWLYVTGPESFRTRALSTKSIRVITSWGFCKFVRVSHTW